MKVHPHGIVDVLRRLGVKYFFKYLQVKKNFSFVEQKTILMGRYFIEKLQDVMHNSMVFLSYFALDF